MEKRQGLAFEARGAKRPMSDPDFDYQVPPLMRAMTRETER